MSDEQTPLSTFVEPEITDARIARQWAAMEGRGLPGAARGRGVLALSFAASLGAALILFAWLAGPRTVTSGASMESAGEPISVHLRDGSSVELAAQTRMRMLRDQADAVEVELSTGRATFDVAHVPGRTFSVLLGSAKVRVVGTRFEVVRAERSEGALLQVSVSRGVVEVQRSDQPGDVRRLTAGETWSALLPRTGQVEPSAAPPAAATVADQAEPAEDALDAQDTAEIEVFELDDVGDSEAAEPRGSSGHGSARARAREVFQRANVARRAGQMREAEAAYSELLARYPRDGRFGVVAFELGRIRMDALGDPKGAVAAFSRALEASPDASFREDALARIVIARDAMGQGALCRAARERYLASYPRGVHAVSVAARCK